MSIAAVNLNEEDTRYNEKDRRYALVELVTLADPQHFFVFGGRAPPPTGAPRFQLRWFELNRQQTIKERTVALERLP